MDGNDMGSQLRHMTDTVIPPADKMIQWIKKMSIALDTCAQEAAKAGIRKVLHTWWLSNTPLEHNGSFILPIRPIVVGGDDIIVICHVAFAMTFVKEAITVFNDRSKAEAAQCGKDELELWPATNGELTISAGVLFCPVSLPLHTAIGYAESLLASAKSRGRKVYDEQKRSNTPTPASIDWEQVTDSIVDTPSARRQREMQFIDGDTGRTVLLTSRPVPLSSLKKSRHWLKIIKTTQPLSAIKCFQPYEGGIPIALLLLQKLPNINRFLPAIFQKRNFLSTMWNRNGVTLLKMTEKSCKKQL